MKIKYYTRDNWICFRYNFNEPLDNYTDIIINCTQIIFLDYDDNDNELRGNKFTKFNKNNFISSQ